MLPFSSFVNPRLMSCKLTCVLGVPRADAPGVSVDAADKMPVADASCAVSPPANIAKGLFGGASMPTAIDTSSGSDKFLTWSSQLAWCLIFNNERLAWRMMETWAAPGANAPVPEADAPSNASCIANSAAPCACCSAFCNDTFVTYHPVAFSRRLSVCFVSASMING